jgi:aerobic carbon-monoxide dehydrogenase large subunit
MTEQSTPGERYIGSPVRRMEDLPLLKGAGRFVDDMTRPGLLQACFLRSHLAHGMIRQLDLEAARAMPGVAAVFGWGDIAPHLAVERMPLAMPGAAIRHIVEPEFLAGTEVTYVGQPIAIVLAQTRALAEDAAATIGLEIDPLPAVCDIATALAPDAPRAISALPDNLLAAFSYSYGDTAAAFGTAAHVVDLELHQHKCGGHPMECRGMLAEYDDATGVLCSWDGTQMPHRAREIIVKSLGWSEDRVRVICPDVGGGFGPKLVIHAEQIVVPLAAWLVRRPVKWIEDRREHFTATTMERDQFWKVRACADADGRLLALDVDMIHDHGAATPAGINVPQNSGTNTLGPYRLPAFEFKASVVLTNKTPVTPTRGAGRPQGTFAMERALDALAGKIGLDRAEIRRRNLIGPAEMPYPTPLRTRDGGIMTYDSGDYPQAQAMAITKSGYADFPARQQAARAQGRYIGVGLANYVEGSGRGPFESALVRIGPSGRIIVATGATAQGQGIATALAQIAADALDVAIEDIRIIAGDTAATPLGLGAFASRQTAVGGPAVHLAATEVRNKAVAAAATILDCSAQDIVIVKSVFRSRRDSTRSLTYGEIAAALAAPPGFALPKGSTPGLEATCNFVPEAMTYNNGTHVAEVEVDIATGATKVNRYVVVHDCGRVINPQIVDGQVTGALIQALGTVLLEEMVYDAAAQPLSVNFGEYLLPSSVGLPRLELHHIQSPTPLNPLGAKGAGESGSLAVASCIASAIDNALEPFGVRITRLPVKPMHIVEILAKARRSG